MQDILESERAKRIAILIDGDNAQPTLISNMLAETGKYGQVTIRRIYGDWTTANMNGWKDTLQTNAIQPIQQFRYTTGKNATDSAMIIDCMDILYEGVVDGFCLVSSDSDYTRLATRIREKGVFVMGIGKKMTPRAFVSACDLFVYSENLLPEADFNRQAKQRKNGAGSSESATPDLIPLLRRGFDLAVQDDGWAFLGVMGQHLRQLDPSFDPRTYGYKQLSHLIKAQDQIFKMKVNKELKGTAIISVTLKEGSE
jgi:hypothetical protein